MHTLHMAASPSFIMKIILATVMVATLLNDMSYIYAKTTKTLTATLACDQFMHVYIDGKLAGSNRGEFKAMQFTLHPGTHVLAVKCINREGEAGIMGSLDNALVTDSRWKCLGRERRHHLKGDWAKDFYDDSDWPHAVEYFPNRGWSIWGKIDDISDEASWIWTADKGKHEEAYCRRRVSDMSVKYTHAYKGTFQATIHEVDRALLLHSRAQHEVGNVHQCAEKCRNDKGCLAFNYQYSSSSLARQCELKGAKRDQDPKNFVKRNGYTYYENVGE